MNEEVLAWVRSAENDIKSAETLLASSIYYLTVFCSHQAAEKILKALWLDQKQELPPRTHNLVYLVTELGGAERERQAAADLTPEFIVSRYPMDGITPESIYDNASAKRHLEESRLIFEWAKRRLKI